MQIYISRNGQQYGPYSEEQARAYLASGELQPGDLAWAEGRGDWQPLSALLGPGPQPAAGMPPPPPPQRPSGGNGLSENNLAMIAHLSPIVSGFIGPLIVWLIKKDDPQAGFVVGEAKEALNFQLTVFLALVISGLLTIVVIGGLLMPAIVIANIVFCVIAGLKANEGQPYRYPVTFRLIK